MAMQYLGTPYKWGGNDARGLDCSGLVLKVLHDVGITLPDMTAHSLYEWALRREKRQCEPEQDCLLFFGNDNRMTHVAIALNEYYMVEAGGSGRASQTMSDDDLLRLDARVRIKPINNRGDLIAAIPLTY